MFNCLIPLRRIMIENKYVAEDEIKTYKYHHLEKMQNISK